MNMQPTKYSARLGDHVAFWNRDLVDFEKKALVAVVIGVGLNGRLDLFAYYTGNATGGSRPYAHVMGAWPGDVEATKDQITDSGQWIPMKVYHAEMDRREKLKEEREERERQEKLAEKEAANKPKETTPENPPVTTPTDSEVKSGGRKIQPVTV